MMNNHDPFEKINVELSKNKVVLFMKGDRTTPKCGFSAKVVGILDSLLEHYHTVDVLEDTAIRDDIKLFSDWPTIPQLFVNGELIGGCDITVELFQNGELKKILGLED